MHIPYSLRWNQQNETISHKVENATGIENTGRIQTGAGNRLIPYSCSRVAFPDLDDKCCDVKANKDCDEESQQKIECTPMDWREDPAVEEKDCHFCAEDDGVVDNRCDVNRLEGSVNSLGDWKSKGLNVYMNSLLTFK